MEAGGAAGGIQHQRGVGRTDRHAAGGPVGRIGPAAAGGAGEAEGGRGGRLGQADGGQQGAQRAQAGRVAAGVGAGSGHGASSGLADGSMPSPTSVRTDRLRAVSAPAPAPPQSRVSLLGLAELGRFARHKPSPGRLVSGACPTASQSSAGSPGTNRPPDGLCPGSPHPLLEHQPCVLAQRVELDLGPVAFDGAQLGRVFDQHASVRSTAS